MGGLGRNIEKWAGFSNRVPIKTEFLLQSARSVLFYTRSILQVLWRGIRRGMLEHAGFGVAIPDYLPEARLRNLQRE